METFTVIYNVAVNAQNVEQRAFDIALEQSVEVPIKAIEEPFVLDQVVGKVGDIKKNANDTFEISINFNVENSGFEAAQFLNVLFGNVSLQPCLRRFRLPQRGKSFKR